jgi:hypothetical protein
VGSNPACSVQLVQRPRWHTEPHIQQGSHGALEADPCRRQPGECPTSAEWRLPEARAGASHFQDPAEPEPGPPNSGPAVAALLRDLAACNNL